MEEEILLPAGIMELAAGVAVTLWQEDGRKGEGGH